MPPMTSLAINQTQTFVKQSSCTIRRPFCFRKLENILLNSTNLSTKRSAPPCATAESETSPSQNEEEEDLWQFPDRDQWYLAKFAADDQPDWNPATFIRSRQLTPGVKEFTLQIETSRERIPLRNAYKHVGQAARIRINGSAEILVPPTTPPPSIELLQESLVRTRGDIFAGETKVPVESTSALAELSVLVRQDVSTDFFKASQGDLFEIGPFEGTGLNLRGPISTIFGYPTVILFCQSDGIAAARALVAATDTGGLYFPMRKDVRMYYRAPNQASICFADELDSWKELYGVEVIVSTRDSFEDMFDDDNTLMYVPETTAAVILTGDNEEAEKAALAVCAEAEIEVIVKQSEPQPAVKHFKDGKNEY